MKIIKTFQLIVDGVPQEPKSFETNICYNKNCSAVRESNNQTIYCEPKTCIGWKEND